MIQTGLPQKQGLYDPKHESDACGIGIVAQIDGISTHHMIKDALTILRRLEHRGGRGADGKTGDGAGLMLEVPDQLFRQTWNHQLPEQGDYAVGMVFLPKEPSLQQQAKDLFNHVISKEGYELIGWRDVPVDETVLSASAQAHQPAIHQLFIKKPHSTLSDERFVQDLYLIRRIVEKRVKKVKSLNRGPFYIVSLSPHTLVYKGMLSPEQIDQFYLDLANPQTKTSFGMVHSRYSTNTFPSWERAHPNRMLMHNGEINTIRSLEMLIG
ncbi:hypothetical protein [Alkalibacillus aidingensis]|nr:hypothetical protein [Alkalibacillus aidingensis]